MPKKPAKRTAFYAWLPTATVKEINRRVKTLGVPQWMVVAEAMLATTRNQSPKISTKTCNFSEPI